MRILLARRSLSHGNGGCGRRRPGPGLRTLGAIEAHPMTRRGPFELLLRLLVDRVLEHARTELLSRQAAPRQVRGRLESVRHQFVAYTGLEFDEAAFVENLRQPALSS